jgi:type IV secretion system protein VirD4
VEHSRYCVVFVRGFDPVVDEKYKIFDKEEYKRAKALGPYEHPRIPDDLYDQGRISFYVDQEGANGTDRSYRFQVETYHGIFEESVIYQKMMQEIEGGRMIPNKDLGGYRCDMMEELERFYPVIDSKQVDIVHSGKLTMHKHPVIGVYTQTGTVMELPPKELKTVFASSERVNAAMMKQSGW